MLFLTFACSAPPPPPPTVHLRVAEGAVFLGELRLVSSPFEDPPREIRALAEALRAELAARPAERIEARVPATAVAGSLSDLVYVADQIGVPLTWRQDDGTATALSLVDFSRLAPTGWLTGQRGVLVTTVIVDREGRREGNVALVSAPVTAGRLDDPTTRPAGALDPREPVDCARSFTDPAALAACEHPPEAVPNAFAPGCFLPAREAGADWSGRVAELAPRVGRAADERWLLVPKDLPLTEVAPLLTELAALGDGPVAFLGGRVRQDCAMSVPFAEPARPDLLGAVMVGKGLHHEMARKPPPPPGP